MGREDLAGITVDELLHILRAGVNDGLPILPANVTVDIQDVIVGSPSRMAMKQSYKLPTSAVPPFKLRPPL
jgi:hypothetical protein